MNPSRVREDVLPSAESLGLVQLVHVDEASSTMELAHALAANGAPAGVAVVADYQHRGRGRSGKVWASEHGEGLWLTLIERPRDQRVVGVLSLRLGLAIADALTPFVDSVPQLKWPNDVVVGAGKIAGILVEARWRENAVDWVAIGVGINLLVPEAFPEAAAVRRGIQRSQVLLAVMPRLREAAAKQGPLTAAECAAWAARDLAQGKRLREPLSGVAQGINADGALLVITAPGTPPVAVHAGSLVFDSPEDVC